MKRRVVSLLLVLVMSLGLVACGGTGSKTNAGNEGDAAESGAPVEITEEGITITLWHSMNTGANGDSIADAVARFNESNEYGITVEAEYIGNYVEIYSKTVSAIAAGNNPVLAVLSTAGLPNFAEKGVLADLSGYAERDGFDMDNVITQLTECTYYNDKVVSLPYTRSVNVLAYNKTMWNNAGVALPTNMDELAKAGKTIHDKLGVYGYSTYLDVSYFQDALLVSLGSDGIMGTGKDVKCLEDGSMETLLTDWVKGLDEGWIEKAKATNTEAMMKQSFFTGATASMNVSSGGLTNMVETCKASGIDLGVAPMVGYNGYACSTGGGNWTVIQKNHSPQEIAAAWEFVKFMMSDEEVAATAVATGYLPTTYSSVETDTIKNLWQSSPEFKVAYDSLANASTPVWSTYRMAWEKQVKAAMSYAVMDGSMSPKQVVEDLKQQKSLTFSE